MGDIERSWRQVGRWDISVADKVCDQLIEPVTHNKFQIERIRAQTGIESIENGLRDLRGAFGNSAAFEFRSQCSALDCLQQNVESFTDQSLVIFRDLVGGAEFRLHRPKSKQPVGKTVNRADIGGIEIRDRIAKLPFPFGTRFGFRELSAAIALGYATEAHPPLFA